MSQINEQVPTIESEHNVSPNATNNSTDSNQFNHQQTTSILLNHHDHYKPPSQQLEQRQNNDNSPTLRVVGQEEKLQTLTPQNHTMAMHNFGPNPHHHQQQQQPPPQQSQPHQQQDPQQRQQQKAPDPSPRQSSHNDTNCNNKTNNNDNQGPIELLQNSTISQLNAKPSTITNTPPSDLTPSISGGSRQHQSQQPQQKHGSLQNQQAQSTSTNNNNNTSSNNNLQASLASRVDQIIRATLHDSPAHIPRSSNNISNSSGMPSPSSSIIFNPATCTFTTVSSSGQTNPPTLTNFGGLNASATTLSQLNSLYGSTMLGDPVNFNNINNNSNPSNPRTSAQSASHSAMAAAAALQSLNQSHMQRSQQSHHQPFNSTPSSSAPTTIPRQPSTLTPQAAHGSNTNSSMPKLGITSTTSSDHQNHNHHLGLSSQQQDSLADLSSRNNSNGNNNLSNDIDTILNNKSMSYLASMRPPMNWQDQVLNANMASAGIPRWQTPAHGGINMNSLQAQSPYTSIGGINLPISQDGDNLSRLNRGMDRKQGTNTVGFNSEEKNSDLSMNLSSNMLNSAPRLNQSWSDNSLRNPSHLSELSARPPSQQRVPPEQDLERNSDRLALFVYNLMSPCIPGTNKPKKIIQLDDELRQSIYLGEFYTRFEHVALGILTNQAIAPGFSIIDYIRRDKFSFNEVEKIENVHRKLGVVNFLCLIELAQQRPYINPSPSNKTNLSSGDINRGQTSSDTYLGGHFNTSSFNVPPSTPMTSINQQQISSLKNNQFEFLSPFPSGKPELGLLGIDKSGRSSQSPNETNSRSHMNNNAPRLQSAHSSFQQQSHSSFAPGCSLQNDHQQPPSAIFTSRNQPYPSLPSTLQPHRSSPFQSPSSINPHSVPRPPRSHSTIGGMGIGSHDHRLFSPPTAQIRQPPAAHQNSSRPNLPSLGSDIMSIHAHSCSTPVSAHMSSKAPQTPRLHETYPAKLPPPSNLLASQHSVKLPRGQQPQVPNSQSPNKMSIDPLVGPSGSMGSRQQQEFISRDFLLRRSGTPQYPPNCSAQVAHGMYSDPNRGLNDPGISSRSPQNSQQMTSLYGNQFVGPASHNGSFKQLTSNSPMPPNSMMTNQQIDYFGKPIPPDFNKQLNLPPNLSVSAANEAQLKQYSALMSAYQQQQIIASKSPNSALTGQSINQFSSLPLSGDTSTVSLDPFHQQQTQQQQSNILRVPNQQVSPRQRSIITGSVSTGAKKGKKSKFSPPNSAIMLDTRPGVTNLAIGAYQMDETEKMSVKLESIPSSETTTSIAVKSETRLEDSCAPDLNELQQVNAPVSQIEQTLNANNLSAVMSNNVDESISKQHMAITSGNFPAHISTSHSDAAQIAAVLANELGSDCRAHAREHQTVSNLTDPCTQNNTPFTNKTETSATSIDEKNPDEKVNIDLLPQPDHNISTPIDSNNLSTISDKREDSSKCSTITNNSEELAPIQPSQASKYQKLFTKKAWLKNYDQEDQTQQRAIEETNAENSNMILRVKNEHKKDDLPMEQNESKSSSPSPLSKKLKKLRRMPKRKVKLNSDRESDGPSSPKARNNKEGPQRRRDRKQKNSDDPASVKRKYSSDEEPVPQHKTKKVKEPKEANIKTTDKTEEAEVKTKKRIGEKFLQTEPCFEFEPKSIRCLECRRVRHSSSKSDKTVQNKQTRSNFDDFCRFFEFRKLRYNKAGQILVAGFSDLSDVKDSDKRLWLPSTDEIPKNINFKVAKFILSNIGDQFCKIVTQEQAVKDYYTSKLVGDKKITWKRAVNGLRELCDVCSTTLFNYHYVCERCGFVVCIDCYTSRANRQAINDQEDNEEEGIKKENSDKHSTVNANGEEQAPNNKRSKKDSLGWIYCAKTEEHTTDKLTLAQIIAGDCLDEVWRMLHETRERLELGTCSCKKISNGKSTFQGATVITLKDDNDNKVFDFSNEDESQDDSKQVSAAIEECIASLSSQSEVDDSKIKLSTNDEYSPSVDRLKSSKASTHSYLCDGDLLVLSNPRHRDNIRLFRQHWVKGKPVIVRGVHKLMDIETWWLPKFFAKQFGEYRSDLVDCRNGEIHRHSMKKYWEGFEPGPGTLKKKPKDENALTHIPPATVNEEPSAISTSYYTGSALWRLKDWPPGQDFKEELPMHYEDFMTSLPLRSYTTRTGKLNLACRLLKEMLKPDLGPKMYSAYGTSKFPERGTTNLHLDISDAINVMVYVSGASAFGNGSTELRELYDGIIDDCTLEEPMKAQIREQNLIPGALWHIFRPADVSKMREFLNKVSDERKISPEKRNDPIHDQIWYLDQVLLDRLHNEYGVKSYPILQCMGDAILIPAGAPHQVKNLQNCIKVANDFVSPENVHYCLQLTDEFRSLPETHMNQEDKLQIKNILYHSIKESLQYVKLYEASKIGPGEESSDDDDCDEGGEDSGTASDEGYIRSTQEK